MKINTVYFTHPNGGNLHFIFNGSLLVQEGLGYAICFDGLINLNEDSDLCFRPIRPALEATPHIIWKRYQVHTKAVQKFLEKLQEQQ